MIRHAEHAGSWYEADARILGPQLDRFLDEADRESSEFSNVKAIISPHAGYRFCGRTAGYSYAALRRHSKSVKRVYIFGPLHHLYSSTCLLSLADSLETPFGPLRVDVEEVKRLKTLGFSSWSNISEEEEEHSLEMQFPFISRVFGSNPDLLVVPIGVGNISFSEQVRLGSIFSSTLASPENIFVISSDFCHWGSRFRYQFRFNTKSPIFEDIEKLDHMGMDIIETKDHKAFNEYLNKTKNTICGRNPISLLLSILSEFPSFKVKFLKYEQSSKCESVDDSSVSYAAGIVMSCD